MLHYGSLEGSSTTYMAWFCLVANWSAPFGHGVGHGVMERTANDMTRYTYTRSFIFC